MGSLLAVLGLVAGCVVLPQPPPVLAPDGKATLGATWGYAAAPVKIVASRPGEAPVTLTKTSDGYGGVPVFDPRVSLAGAVAPGWVVGGHASFVTLGLELRRMISEDRKRLFAITLGTQVDGPLLLAGSSDHPAYPGFAWEARAGATFQPELGDHVQLVFGLGGSFGPRRHSVVLDDGVLGSTYGVDQQVPNQLRLLRPEVRVEGLLGVMVRPSWAATPWLGVLVAAQPYVIAHAGDITGAACQACASGVVVQSLDATYGVAVTASLVIGGPRGL